nr:uncharacterized protein CI109_007331 [Kwoniella shandongensis]KAA5524348.1 hypothetical protein CI109_007331 [Kwoniella shandongensis]
MSLKYRTSSSTDSSGEKRIRVTGSGMSYHPSNNTADSAVSSILYDDGGMSDGHVAAESSRSSHSRSGLSGLQLFGVALQEQLARHDLKRITTTDETQREDEIALNGSIKTAKENSKKAKKASSSSVGQRLKKELMEERELRLHEEAAQRDLEERVQADFRNAEEAYKQGLI